MKIISIKPRNFNEYRDWLGSEHDVRVSGPVENHYTAVVSKVVTEFEASAFWQGVLKRLGPINQEYYLESDGYYLFLGRDPPELKTKSFESFLNKTFRKNVLSNAEWPEPQMGNGCFRQIGIQESMILYAPVLSLLILMV